MANAGGTAGCTWPSEVFRGGWRLIPAFCRAQRIAAVRIASRCRYLGAQQEGLTVTFAPEAVDSSHPPSATTFILSTSNVDDNHTEVQETQLALSLASLFFPWVRELRVDTERCGQLSWCASTDGVLDTRQWVTEIVEPTASFCSSSLFPGVSRKLGCAALLDANLVCTSASSEVGYPKGDDSAPSPLVAILECVDGQLVPDGPRDALVAGILRQAFGLDANAGYRRFPGGVAASLTTVDAHRVRNVVLVCNQERSLTQDVEALVRCSAQAFRKLSSANMDKFGRLSAAATCVQRAAMAQSIADSVVEMVLLSRRRPGGSTFERALLDILSASLPPTSDGCRPQPRCPVEEASLRYWILLHLLGC